MRSSYIRLAVIGVLTVFLAGSASASGVEVAEEDEVVWLNDGADDKVVDFQARCTGENVGIEDVGVWDGSQEFGSGNSFIEIGEEETNEEGNLTEAEFWFDVEAAIEESGENFGVDSYQGFVQCTSDEGTKFEYADFELDMALLKMESPREGAEVYLGDKVESEVKLHSERGNLDLSKVEEVEMTLENDNGEQKILRNTNFRSENMVLESDDDLSLDFIEGDEAGGVLDVAVTYGQTYSGSDREYSFGFSDSADVNIQRYEIIPSVRPSRRMSYEQLEEMNVTVEMRYEGEPLTPERDDESFEGMFFLERGDDRDPGNYDWFSGGFTGVTDDGYGRYSLKLEKIPDLDVSPENQRHTLEVLFEEENYGELPVTDVHVRKAFTFEGRVADSNFRSVSTDFRLDAGDFVETFSTNPQGEFNRRIVPGDYGFLIEFPRADLILENVDLEEGQNGEINHHYYENPDELELDAPGVRPVNMMAMEFTYPFERADIHMDYNPAAVDDPTDVDVYECRNWNFFAESCASDWQRISPSEVTLPPGQWEAQFPTDPWETDQFGGTDNVLLPAYIVGTNPGLDVGRVSLNTASAAEGETISVSGNVNSDGGELEGVEVEFALVKDGEYFANATDTTDSSGEFSIETEAPEEGEYRVFISAQKEPYEGFSSILDVDLETYKQADLSFSSEEMVLTPGESTTSTAELENTGQVTFSTIDLELENLGDLSGELSQDSFSSVQPGDTVETEVQIELPEDHCNPSCARFPIVELSVDAEGENGDRIMDSFDLDLEVDPDRETETSQDGGETEETSTEETEGNGTFSGMTEATGDFVQSQGALNIGLGLITVLALVLAGAVKKNNGDSGSSDRERRVSLQKPNVEPAHDEDVEEVAKSVQEDTDEPPHKSGQKQKKELDDDDEWFDQLDKEEAEKVEEKEEESTTEEQPENDSTEEDSDSSAQENKEQYTCNTCGETFETKPGLRLHRDALHKDGSDESEDDE